MLPGNGVVVWVLRPLALLFIGSSVRALSGIQQKSRESVSESARWRQCLLTVGAHGQGAWVDDEEQDWEESSFEEGELVEGWEEEEWWASGRGKELVLQGNIASMAIEDKEGTEGTARLVEGVYMLDAGVATKGGVAGPGKGDSAAQGASVDTTHWDNLSLMPPEDSKKGDKEEEPVSKCVKLLFMGLLSCWGRI
ncbi:hypothetical protein NDU88_008857 [Pleurodeles waltl]|uniref:Uncharacterized protein n=1 Tax=Pleurodeles waltl TaxID=8319 RepID=A0AAV7QVV5_PLEWA|nr:hypothetical protein NDU88_008857 [Pleurodeles waltl]